LSTRSRSDQKPEERVTGDHRYATREMRGTSVVSVLLRFGKERKKGKRGVGAQEHQHLS
jgi:hypothetical protein